MTNDPSHQSVCPSNGSSQALRIIVCLVVLAVAAVVRIHSARNELWLDEIWSLHLASELSWPLEIITNIHHYNNHYLTTWYFYLIGPQCDAFAYRIPALLAGIGTVALAGLIGGRRNTASALLAMLLTGSSYVLILYSSEARGFAAGVFFSFLSFYLLDRYLETREWPFALMFSVSAVLGFLSQMVFLSFYLAALVWSGYRLLKSRAGAKQIAIAASSCHAAPLLFFAMLYLVDIRHIVMEGAPASILRVYAEALAWALGTPLSPLAIVAMCAAAGAILIVGLRMLWRAKSDLFVFFAGVILVFPLLLAVVSASSVFYVRYFIVAIAFFLILFSFVLADLYQRSPLGKAICAAVLLAYFAANGWHVATLFQCGRGHYGEAIRFLKEHSNQWPITVASDQDLRIGGVLQYYDQSSTEPLRYYMHDRWPRQGPEWVICHKESFQTPVPPAIRWKDNAGNEYEVVQAFPTAPLSGLHWFIYHNRAK